MTPFREIGLGSVRQEHGPCLLKVRAGLIEGHRRPIGLLSRMTARIEAAGPTPRVFIKRDANPYRDWVWSADRRCGSRVTLRIGGRLSLRKPR
jgi:hypothetical protein